MFLNQAIINRLRRSKHHRLAVIHPGFLHSGGIDAEQGFAEGSIAIDPTGLLRLVKEFIAKIRVSQADHGHGSFLNVFP